MPADPQTIEPRRTKHPNASWPHNADRATPADLPGPPTRHDGVSSEPVAQTQSLREQRFARALDREIAPVWHDRFARLIWRHLPTADNVFALDVHSGAGRTTYELLDRLGGAARVLGLESDETMRGMAKARMEPAWKDRVYFRSGDLTDIADMAENTYDLLVANLVLSEAHDLSQVLEEFTRVVKPGGRILATLPMAGTWTEVEDLFQLVLTDSDRADAARRLRRLGRMRKTGPEIARIAGTLGIPGDRIVVEQERFKLLFSSGREFLFSPMVEHGPLRAWKAILGESAKQQELFWQLKESIDAYYDESVFAVTIVAGVVVLGVPEAGTTSKAGFVNRYWAQYSELDRLFDRAEKGELQAEDDEDDDLEIDFDEEEASDADDGPAPAASASMTMEAEDAAIFALLEGQPAAAPAEQDTELDALLDQVLEFASTPDARAADALELEPEDLEAIAPSADIKTKPGDTLSRIRALLPPPPGAVPMDSVDDQETRPRPKVPAAAPPRRRMPPPPPPPRKKKR